MARVIEYKVGKKYITDVEIGRSWRVPEKREKEGGEEAQVQWQLPWEEKEI